MLEDYCSPTEAARILGVSRQTAYNLARLYRWTTETVLDRTLYLRADVEATPRDEHARRLFAQHERRKREASEARKAKKALDKQKQTGKL